MMRVRRGVFLLVCGLLGCGVAVLPAVAGSETTPTVEAVNSGIYSHAWSPTQVPLATGGVLTLKNAGPVQHGVKWVSGPATPACQGVPVETSEVKWSGTCTFATAGTYVFYCTVHGSEMTATVTVAGGETTGGAPPGTGTQPGAGASPAPGATPAPAPSLTLAATGVALARSQHGRTVRGSLTVPAAAAGGRLQVDLLAGRASLARGAGAPVRVGRLVRTPLRAGRLSFAVRLDAAGRRALARHHRLALTVRVLLAPPHGSPALSRRSVVLHP